MTLNGGGGANGFLLLNQSLALSGKGTLTLATAGGGGEAYIEQAVGGLTLTNVDSTIQGAGVVGNGGLTLVNQATSNANLSGQALTLNGSGGITNTGVLEASNGGVLQLAGVVVHNTGGNIKANAGSTVQLYGDTQIQGGTLTNNGSFFGTPVNNVAFLDGSTAAGTVTINGTYTSDTNSETFLLGTINNKGNIQVNGGSGYNAFLLPDSSNVLLQGGGTVTLTAASGGGNAYIEQPVGGVTLTNVDNTIQGTGVIENGGLTLVNQAAGTLLANVSGHTLLINGSGGLTNSGTVQVNSGSTLQVTSAFTQTGGKTQVDGALIASAGESVTGGTVLGTGTIDGNVTLTGGAVQPGQLNAPGTLTMNGNYSHSNAAFNELINSSGNGLFVVNGFATLGPGALLNIDLLDGFTPTDGETFILMDYFSGSGGAFANAPTTGFQMDGFNWTIAYNSTDIVLDAGTPFGTTPTPEPGSVVLLVFGLAALSWQRLRKKPIEIR